MELQALACGCGGSRRVSQRVQRLTAAWVCLQWAHAALHVATPVHRASHRLWQLQGRRRDQVQAVCTPVATRGAATMALTRSTRRRVLLEPRLLACHRRTTHLTTLGTWATMTVQHVCRRCSPGLRPAPGPTKRLRPAMLQRSHLNCSRQPTNQSIWHNDNIINNSNSCSSGSSIAAAGSLA